MKKIAVLCGSMGMLISTSAMAENTYFGIDYTQFSWETTYFSGQPSAIKFDMGYLFNNYFGIEGMYAIGVDDDVYDSALIGSDPSLGNIYLDRKTSVDSLISAGLVGKYPFGEYFEIFGKVGYSTLTYKFSAELSAPSYGITQEVDSEKFDGSGIYYGVGAALRIEQHALLLEYNKLPDVDLNGDTMKTTSINLGYRYGF